MTPSRLRQIEELYHRAREAPAHKRAALLDQTDPELRREVESLLARQDDSLILDRPAQWSDETSVNLPGAAARAGALLGPYRLETKLGEGGMGEVFQALDTRLGRRVAIKFVYQRFNQRFDREARAISSLNHSNICTLYDIGPDYLVMELLEGETLGARLKNGPMPLEDALRYAAQIAGALATAHEHGIVHRDLKPGNIMLTKSGVKILDFGLATREGDDTVTAAHMVLGTPAYMAPEQRQGKPADARTDLYSFGCVLYEMLTGARATADRRPVPLRPLEEVVARCLAVDPAQRWQSAAELADAIEAVRRPKTNRKWLIPAAAILLALAIAGWFSFRPAPRLTDKDTVVLADFVNNTGEPIFDGTLRQGLAMQLEQSPFLKIMDDEEMQRELRLMSVAPGARITNPVAHEICVRAGAAATIGGAIVSLGKNYVVTLQAITCQDGVTLARQQLQAEDKEHVLNAVGSAATVLRGRLGESLNSVQKLSRPLEQATTGSLEALKNFTEGRTEMAQGHFLAAVPLLQRATVLDPAFATAWSLLGTAFDNAGDVAKSREYGQKALSLIDRVTPLERDEIAASWYEQTGELDKAMDAWRSGIRNYPRHYEFHNNLSTDYIDLGQYEEGLKEGLLAASEPNFEPPYRRQLDALMCLDRLPEARSLADKLRVQPFGARIHQRLLELAYIDTDTAAAAREIQWFAAQPAEYLSLGLQAADRNVRGERRESHNLFQRAADTALRSGLANAASEFKEADAQADALAGNCETVRRLGRPALALAICGDAAGAEKLAAETSRVFPNGTIWNTVQLPAIRAAIALRRDQPATSVELLASASPYERAHLEAIYLRGLAYLRMHKGVEAAGEFVKIADHKGANWASEWRHPYWGQFYSLSRLGMARAFALSGDVTKARKAFEDFFKSWKNADRDIPILQQAKTEYAALR